MTKQNTEKKYGTEKGYSLEKKYDAVIFDLDGTLLNTLEDLRDSVNYALDKHGMTGRTLEEIRHFVGNGVQRLLELSVPDGTSKELFEKVFITFKEYYAIHCNDKTGLYAGIEDILIKLKEQGFRMAIVSNKLQEGVDALNRQYFEKYMQAAIGVRDGMRKKPAADSVFEAMKILNVSKDRVVYVGDSEVDIATAKNAGLPCITVTWGFRTKEEQEKAGAQIYAVAPEELMNLLYNKLNVDLTKKDLYQVKKLENCKKIEVQVPGSKSITNRALLLAALSNQKCLLKGVLFSDDSRAFLDSLQRLGFEVEINEPGRAVAIQGMGGKIPNSHAQIDVRSAGTAARFLTVMLALAGGEFEMNASPQMCKRPMEPLLTILKKAGVEINYKGEEGHFPFVMKSDKLSMKEVSIDTKISSQFASALLMSGVLMEEGLKVNMAGDRAEGAYIKMTLSMMEQFGIHVRKEGSGVKVSGNRNFGLSEYLIEPDVSGACYFYAMAPLLKTDVIVKGVHLNSLQGDIKFINLLEKMGCVTKEQENGLMVKGAHLKSYPGLDVSMKDFSDQTMTMAAIAPFANSPTLIQNVGHIRFQESDRISAIVTELNRMGISCEEVPEEDGIRIVPVSVDSVKETAVETYDDHRMAMAFTLVGLKTGKITIKDPGCCRKTFENYFSVIEELY